MRRGSAGTEADSRAPPSCRIFNPTGSSLLRVIPFKSNYCDSAYGSYWDIIQKCDYIMWKETNINILLNKHFISSLQNALRIFQQTSSSGFYCRTLLNCVEIINADRVIRPSTRQNSSFLMCRTPKKTSSHLLSYVLLVLRCSFANKTPETHYHHSHPGVCRSSKRLIRWRIVRFTMFDVLFYWGIAGDHKVR